jgi:hypothetical protein
VSSGYRKFCSRFANDANKRKTFASFATFAGGGQNFEAQAEAEKAKAGTPEIQSASVKVAQVAKVGAPEAVCAVSTAVYQAASPDCSVTVIELPTAQSYHKTFAALHTKRPVMVDVDRWRQCVEDGRAFLAKWGEQAEALGWTSANLFGLHTPPEQPHPSYRRLSRYDATGLVWLLDGREVVALSEATASIRNPTSGSVTVYRRHNKPALGPLGDSLEDLR